MVGDQIAQNGFSLSIAVDICAVEKIDTGIQAAVEHHFRFGLVRFAPECHRAHAELGDPDTRIAKESIFHGDHPKL